VFEATSKLKQLISYGLDDKKFKNMKLKKEKEFYLYIYLNIISFDSILLSIKVIKTKEP